MARHILFILLVLSLGAFSQEPISGVIFDKNTPLPYATVQCQNNSFGTISNKNGVFSVPRNIDTIIVSHIGYKTQKVKLSPDSLNKIFLIKDTASIKEVVVLDCSENQLSELIYKAIKKQKKHRKDKISWSKSYIKIYSTSSNEKPIEFAEGLYGIRQNYQGIREVFLKNGKFYFSENNRQYYSLNFVSSLIPNLAFFSNKETLIENLSPLNLKSKKTIHQFYTLTFLGVVNSVLEIEFSSKINRNHRGVIFLDFKTNRIIKISITKPLKTQHIVKSLIEENKVTDTQLNLNIEYNHLNLIKLMVCSVNYKYHQPNAVENINTDIILNLYDFDEPFLKVVNLPVSINDYETMQYINENNIFWEDSRYIVKTKKEKQFVNKMKYHKGFQTLIIDDDFFINKERIASVIPKNQFNYFLYKDKILSKEKHNPYFHLDIQLIANVEKMKNQTVCDVYPVINYSNSYSLLNNDSIYNHLANQLIMLSKKYAQRLQEQLLIKINQEKVENASIREIVKAFQNSFYDNTQSILVKLTVEDTFKIEKNGIPISSKEKIKKIINQ